MMLGLLMASENVNRQAHGHTRFMFYMYGYIYNINFFSTFNSFLLIRPLLKVFLLLGVSIILQEPETDNIMVRLGKENGI